MSIAKAHNWFFWPATNIPLCPECSPIIEIKRARRKGGA
jgi:hypothetical protein